MTEILKRKQVRVYVDQTDEARLSALVDAIGSLSESSVMTAILAAGLKACADAGNRLPLPLKFHIIEPLPQIMRAEEKPASSKLNPARK